MLTKSKQQTGEIHLPGYNDVDTSAAKEMVQAISEEKAEHLFPWQLAVGTALGQMQPKWVLKKFFELAVP